MRQSQSSKWSFANVNLTVYSEIKDEAESCITVIITFTNPFITITRNGQTVS